MASEAWPCDRRHRGGRAWSKTTKRRNEKSVAARLSYTEPYWLLHSQRANAEEQLGNLAMEKVPLEMNPANDTAESTIRPHSSALPTRRFYQPFIPRPLQAKKQRPTRIAIIFILSPPSTTPLRQP